MACLDDFTPGSVVDGVGAGAGGTIGGCEGFGAVGTTGSVGDSVTCTRDTPLSLSSTSASSRACTCCCKVAGVLLVEAWTDGSLGCAGGEGISSCGNTSGRVDSGSPK